MSEKQKQPIMPIATMKLQKQNSRHGSIQSDRRNQEESKRIIKAKRC